MMTDPSIVDLIEQFAWKDCVPDDASRFAWLLNNATLTTTIRNGVKVWSLEVVGDYPHDAGMGDVRDMIDILRSA